jgi:tetratricopeptide (TPR) repeat protein
VGPEVTVDGASTERPGTVIGPYKLLQQIGEGGMGVVWMAEQTRPVQRKVALKVIKPGMDSRQVVARFEAERQALAMMDHVNIARVFDGGATEDGRPYFVMELVHGVPITKYSDENQLTPRERLELFVPVCQAIQHAHQKGIIHRDIKPSNVMVTLYDGKPVPKVIDFGVAKATEQKLTERTLFTQYGTMVGTFEYMSPEQAEMSALGVDTRSDIYSLGVLLYELLTGSTPLSHKRVREAAYAEILRMIKEEEPQKPSTRLSDSGETLASISAQRHMEPAKLTKLVRGELDWIVMKCLEKDRNRRYETASGFAADIQRYLADEPVQACPPSVGYRFRKFARRYKKVMSTAAAFALLLIFGALLSAWQAMRATVAEREAIAAAEQVRGERDRALAAEREARAEKANTKAALDFIWEGALSQASPVRQADADMKVRALLDRAADLLERDSRLPPLVEAAVRQMIGQSFLDLGQRSKALTHLERALEIQRRNLGEEDPQTLATMHALGSYLCMQGQLDEAGRLLGRTLELRRRLLGEEHLDTLLTTRWAGDCAFRQGRDEEAARLLTQATQTLARVHGEGHRHTTMARILLAEVLERRGEHAEAKALATQSLERSRRFLGEDHFSTLSAMITLARIDLAQGDAAQAELLAAQSLKSNRRIYGNQHAETIRALHFLTRVYHAQGKYADATPLATELLATFREQAGGDDRGLASALQMLGQNLLGEKKYPEAEPYLRECLAIRGRVQPHSWLYFNTQSHLGACLLGQKKYAEAEPLLLRGCEGLKQRERQITVGNEVHLTEALERLVQLYDAWGKPDEAATSRKEQKERQATKRPEKSK